jgi:hypothetical protein
VALPELVAVDPGALRFGLGFGLARAAVAGSDEVTQVLEVRLRVAAVVGCRVDEPGQGSVAARFDREVVEPGQELLGGVGAETEVEPVRRVVPRRSA